MSNQEYNGWTNWETWNFKLWIDNSEDSYKAVMFLAKEAWNKRRANSEKAFNSKLSSEFFKTYASNKLAIELESLANDLCEESVRFETGFFADVCNSAIKKVNFYEIAEAYLDEYNEQK